MPLYEFQLDDRHGIDLRAEKVIVHVDGFPLLRLPLLNKGTGFTMEERRTFHIEGLLPPVVNTLEQQVDRVWRALSAIVAPLDRYQYLRQLQDRQEILFFAVLEAHLEELLPVIYTPTVGEAVRRFSALYQQPRGLTLSTENIDNAEQAVASFPLNDIRMIVATDSSAILGIGDQGYGGLGIPIGKLALYVGGGGVSPWTTLPVVLDVGTDRDDLLEDPFYLGVRHKRLKGGEYLAFIDRFVAAVKSRWPRAVIQWEDLSKDTAFTVLDRHRHTIASFNDDIQGTGAMALAGVIAAAKLRGETLADQRIVIHGAGAGGGGVAWALWQGLIREGLSPADAAKHLWVLDSKGLLVDDRAMEDYKKIFARNPGEVAGWSARPGKPADLLETVRRSRATVLIGLSGQPGVFDEITVRAMAELPGRPVIFPLSNPTTSTEAMPVDLVKWTEGRVILATGSPFAPVEWDGGAIPVPQGNNAFIFPGLGLGVTLCAASSISDGMVMAASRALAEYTIEKHLVHGRVYPPVTELAEVSIKVAARVMEQAVAEGLAGDTAGVDGDTEAYVRAHFWKPRYLPYERAPR